MYAPHPQHPRARQHPPDANMPYRSPEYYISEIATSSAHDLPAIGTSRSFPTYYPDPNTQPTRRLSYESQDTVYYNQSYDRHSAGPPELPLPYKSHQDRPSFLPPLKRLDGPNMVDQFAPRLNQPRYQSEPDTLLTTSPSHSTGEADLWDTANSRTPPQSQPSQSPSSRQKKSRREKPKIALAHDQPPTTQGKPRARVYVACIQCRTRKIRCDGAKPACHNCGRRSAAADNACNYDPIPKRRGPDKTPGARQRMARDSALGVVDGSAKRRRRRITSATDVTSFSASSSAGDASHSDIPNTLATLTLHSPPPTFTPAPSYTRSYSLECRCHGMVHCPDLLEVSALPENRRPAGAIPTSTYHDAFDISPMSSHPNSIIPGQGSFITELDGPDNEGKNDNVPDMRSQPSLNFTRKVWWDSLLCLYRSTDITTAHPLTSSMREETTRRVTHDLRWIFKASNYWFSFFHIPSFFGNFCDPRSRERMQPSLILSLLAMSTFFQSSEVGLGYAGRERALRFRDEAQGALEGSFNSGWIDETLAQAAWLLALFEICAHHHHSSARANSAIIMLDAIIRSLSLTMVDADDPSTTLFPPGSVPVVDHSRNSPPPLEQTAWFPGLPLIRDLSVDATPDISGNLQASSPSKGCSCQSMTLGKHWPSAEEHAPLWGPTPAWNEEWSESDIRKESCRRLCWSSMIMAAGHIAYTTAQNVQYLDLFIANPANYAILFSGESATRSPALTEGYSSKDTIWALHDRCFILWHGCIRMRNDGRASDVDKANFAIKAWLEADALEKALNRHSCDIERAFIFQGREYIFNIRMCVSYEFRRYIPLVSSDVSGLLHRNKAEEWLSHQAVVAERFMTGLHTITGNLHNLLARRPFFVFWFMGQISRALSLWHCDNSLTVALDVCKALLPALDYLTALWPCPEQRHRYDLLRERLGHACHVVGACPPVPLNSNLPPTRPLSEILV